MTALSFCRRRSCGHGIDATTATTTNTTNNDRMPIRILFRCMLNIIVYLQAG
jgi:hypothetical protein